MKKNAFTLAEILIALSIIGVISAITLSSIHQIMPDKDKGVVLKVFQTLNEVNRNVLGNPSLYMFNSDCPAHIMMCNAKPVDGEHENDKYQGINKYPSLLMDNLTLSDSAPTPSGGSCSFTTSDGLVWSVASDSNNGYDIIIDTGNDKRQDCTYSSSCKNPRKFKFNVNSDGVTKAVDNLSKAYLMNPNDLNDRSADLQKAASL